MAASEEEKGSKNFVLVTGKLVYRQSDILKTRAKKSLYHLLITVQVWRRGNMGLRAIVSVSIYRSISHNRSLIVGKESIPVNIGAKFNIEAFSKLDYKTNKDIVSEYFQDIMVLGYFSQIVLESA